MGFKTCHARFVVIRRIPDEDLPYICLHKIYWPEHPTYHEKWAVPGGEVDPGQDFLEAADREAIEELGVELDIYRKFAHHSGNFEDSKHIRLSRYYFAREKPGQQVFNAEPKYHSDLQWFRIDQLPDDMLSAQRHAVLEMFKGKRFSQYYGEPEAALDVAE